jgi:pyrroline-5-carboxylate reductase
VSATDSVLFPPHLLMVGCGNMAGTILGRWLESGLDRARVTIVDPYARALPPGISALAELPDTLPDNCAILLGIKPQNLADVAPVLAPLAMGRLTISMLAGVPVARLGAELPGALVVRIMPNLAVALGKGVCALHAGEMPANMRGAAAAMMAPLGLVEWIADEGQFDLVTAINGCGPAFLFRFIDALGAAGAALGLPADQAARLALATVDGAAALATAADVSPGTLADRVASPGGMTREGLDVLDADGRLQTLLTETLRAARDRGAELARS